MADRFQLDPIDPPDVTHLVTEDDTPVESWFQEKQMRLLTEPLYSSWRPMTADGRRRSFLVGADVGVFGSVHVPAIVPDVMLAMDVAVPDEFWLKEKRSYYMWDFGKPPDVVIEVVSNREGAELDAKRADYSRLGVPYYIVYDHMLLLGAQRLRVFQKHGDLLTPVENAEFPRLGLKLVEWNGAFETKHARWLRWQLFDGELIPTGDERAQREALRAEQEKQRAEEEKQRAEQEKQRAEQEKQRAEQEKQRADRLAAKLRELGVDEDG